MSLAPNPYEVDLEKFEVSFNGFAEGFYCFRLDLSDKGGMDSCMFQMAVSQWLFDNTRGNWHMGNDFPYADHPKLNLQNDKGTDTFVLLEKMVDVVLFEKEFPVLGISPSMLV